MFKSLPFLAAAWSVAEAIDLKIGLPATGAWKTGNSFTAAQKIDITDALNAVNSDFGTITFSDFETNLDGSLSSIITAPFDADPDDNKSALLLQIALADIDDLIQKFNDEKGTTGSLPDLEKFSVVPAAEDVKKIVLSLSSIGCFSNPITTVEKFYAMIREKFAASANLESNIVDLVAATWDTPPVLCTARRLLATSTGSVSFTVFGLSNLQLQALDNQLSSGAFTDKFLAALALNGQSSAGANSGSLTNGDGSALTAPAGTTLYVVPVYKPTANVENMHAATRVQGSNDFANGILNDQSNYLIGAALLGVPCFLGAIYSLFIMPFCYCCCYCANKRPYQGLPLVLILTFATFGFAFIGFAVSLAGNSQFDDAAASFGSAAGDLSRLFLRLGKTFSDFIVGATAVVTVLDSPSTGPTPNPAMKDCPVLGQLRSGFSSIAGQSSPFPDMTSMSQSMLDVEKLIVDNNKMKSDATIAVAVFIMSASVIYTFGVIQMLWATKNKLLGKCGCIRIFGHIFTIVLPILLFVLWVVGAILMTLSVVFGDFCITEPIKAFADALDLDSSVIYLATCVGRAPEALFEIYDAGAKFSDAADNIGAIKVMARASSDVECDAAHITDADFDGLATSIRAAAAATVAVAEVATCSSLNAIMSNLLHQGVCVSLQSGSVSTWVGIGIQGLTTFLGMFFFRRVMKTQAKNKQVAAQDVDSGNEMAAMPP